MAIQYNDNIFIRRPFSFTWIKLNADVLVCVLLAKIDNMLVWITKWHEDSKINKELFSQKATNIFGQARYIYAVGL